MNEKIQLYSWMRGTASIYLAHIVDVQTQQSSPGQEVVTVKIEIDETLWGQKGAAVRQCKFTQPASEAARLKFPDPIWGRVNLRAGTFVVLVTREVSETIADPLYVDEIRDPDDPVQNAIRTVVAYEKAQHEGSARPSMYLRWLAQGPTLAKLFAAEALAKDQDLPGVDGEGRIAVAFADAFTAERDLFVRLSLGAWMWEHVYARTNPAGQVAIINATIKGAEDTSEDVRRFALDCLTTIASVKLEQPAVTKSREAVRRLQERLDQETDPAARDQIQKVIDALRH